VSGGLSVIPILLILYAADKRDKPALVRVIVWGDQGLADMIGIEVGME